MKGQDAFRRLKCYVGTGAVTEDEMKSVIKLTHKKPMKFSTIKEIVGLLK